MLLVLDVVALGMAQAQGSDFWSSALSQVPSLAIVLMFLIYTQRNQAQANERNHVMWQNWLMQREESAKQERTGILTWLQQQADRDKEERERWQKWLDVQAQQRVAEQADVVRALTGVEHQLDTTTQILMVLYATVSGADTETLQRFMRNNLEH